MTPRDSSVATLAANGLLLLQPQLTTYNHQSESQNYTSVAKKVLNSAVRLALAGEISFADIDATNPNATLGTLLIQPTRAFRADSRAY